MMEEAKRRATLTCNIALHEGGREGEEEGGRERRKGEKEREREREGEKEREREREGERERDGACTVHLSISYLKNSFSLAGSPLYSKVNDLTTALGKVDNGFLYSRDRDKRRSRDSGCVMVPVSSEYCLVVMPGRDSQVE